MKTYKVYLKVDEQGRITAINSSNFIDGIGWTEVDEGVGNKYVHAQNNYLSDFLLDEDGFYNYKFENNKIVRRSEEEKAQDMVALFELEKKCPATALEIGAALLEAMALIED